MVVGARTFVADMRRKEQLTRCARKWEEKDASLVTWMEQQGTGLTRGEGET